MEAVYYEKFGGPEVLSLGELPDPVPGKSEALIAVRASALNPVDYRLRNGEARWVMKRQFPRIPGCDFAGEVVQSNIKGTNKGEAVFGFVSSLPAGGSNARLLVAQPQHLAPKPANLTFEEAASLPLAGLTAIQGLRDHARLKNGHSALINGCVGGVGSLAVQYATFLGAHVTGVCSTAKMEMASKLGCQKVIDYTKNPIAGKYDVVFDTVGNLGFLQMKKHLNKNGVMVGLNPYPQHFLTMFWSQFTLRQFKVFLAHPHAADLGHLGKLAGQGALQPVIDKRYKLADVQKAYEYLERGHAAGKVVVS
jgi:NADPH:quinone reductase-like Zn-dependent oxidoreductase